MLHACSFCSMLRAILIDGGVSGMEGYRLADASTANQFYPKKLNKRARKKEGLYAPSPAQRRSRTRDFLSRSVDRSIPILPRAPPRRNFWCLRHLCSASASATFCSLSLLTSWPRARAQSRQPPRSGSLRATAAHPCHLPCRPDGPADSPRSSR